MVPNENRPNLKKCKAKKLKSLFYEPIFMLILGWTDK